MWLEAYLRNGKVIQSNVLEVQTEDGQYDPLAGERDNQHDLQLNHYLRKKVKSVKMFLFDLRTHLNMINYF